MRTVLASILLLISYTVVGQDSTATARLKLSAFPIAFLSPDTKWGVGVAGLASFDIGPLSKKSTVTFGAAYTQLKQLLVYFPYQLFLHENKYWFYGEVGYYKYRYNYFGMGNAVPNEFIEKYDANFPRIRIHALQSIGGNKYIGARIGFDHYQISIVDSLSLLATTKPAGYDGGVLSSIGGQFNYDSRDNPFYPDKGTLLESFLYIEGPWTGSDYRYAKLSLDWSKFIKVGTNKIIGINAYNILSYGNVPIFQSATLGGSKKLRGYYEGKYRDHNLSLLQFEYRRPLFWRFGLVAFAGAGMVYRKIENLKLNHLRPNLGIGLRFVLDKQQKINIRADYGIGIKQNQGFYITINEAF